MSKQLTVLIDATPICRRIDGIGRYNLELISSFAKLYPDYNVILVGFNGDSVTYPEILNLPNITFIKIPVIRKIYSFIYGRFMRIPVDIFLPAFDIFVGLNFKRFPYVKSGPSIVAIHDLAYIRYPETIEKKNLLHLQKHVPLSVSESDSIIAISNFTKHEIIDNFPKTPTVYTVSPGINTEIWKPSTAPRENYLLVVGTLEPRKNLVNVIQAFKILPIDIQTQYPLTIVGSKGWGDTAINEDENIRYTGHIDDATLVELYQKARLFIFPSKYEGFGIPLLEALSTNTPIACSDIPPFREIANNSSAVTFFNPNSVVDIRNSIESELNKAISSSKGDGLKTHLHAWDVTAHSLNRAILETLRK